MKTTEIKITPNFSKRTFTIRKNGSKYRTYPMSQQEFNECIHMTQNDWQQFLKSTEYYLVK
jgi:hypothetical protein